MFGGSLVFFFFRVNIFLWINSKLLYFFNRVLLFVNNIFVILLWNICGIDGCLCVFVFGVINILFINSSVLLKKCDNLLFIYKDIFILGKKNIKFLLSDLIYLIVYLKFLLCVISGLNDYWKKKIK